LAGIGSRFGGRDLLEQILDPSKVMMKSTAAVPGDFERRHDLWRQIVESETEEELELAIGDERRRRSITIQKSSIVGREPSKRIADAVRLAQHP
jgi:hypothetical protein